jgi:SpoVK/Ycf46/Vps4 family AAA+-type ATPase
MVKHHHGKRDEKIALKLDLLKINLSSVVGKYIGETERNLNSVFKEAEKSGSILFFDEADALFGNRSEVKDSHDMMVYLLQKFKEHKGIVILALNLANNIDRAMARRMKFSVEFPIPNNSRRRIWKNLKDSNRIRVNK